MDFNLLRVLVFLFIFTLLISLEVRKSFHQRIFKRIQRWPNNLLLIFLGSFLIKIFSFLGPLGVSQFEYTKAYSVLNILGVNGITKTIISILLLDFFIYFQHVLTHKVNFLWRIHRVHHSDPDLDVTSALRFHPLEIFLSMLYKSLLVLIFGFSLWDIVLFEIILNASAMFNHANIFIPLSFERKLRLVFVTPQMHLIHHSVEQKESDMNYGFCFSFWDRLFGSYLEDFGSNFQIGNARFRSSEEQKIYRLLKQPFE